MSVVERRIATVEDFQSAVRSIESQPGYQRPAAFAVGIASYSLPAGLSGKVLDTYYPVVNKDENHGSAAVLAKVTGHTSGGATLALSSGQIEEALEYFAPFEGDGKEHANVRVLKELRGFAASVGDDPDAVVPRQVVVTFIGDLGEKPADVHDIYLRLHLLSTRKVRPHGQNLDGLFGLLNNVVWTDLGPFDPDTFEQTRLRLRARGRHVRVFGVDKLPHMTDYVIPSGVRIADSSRVRLGAHLGDGTTVMQEGFSNFNAGTLGRAMVEGRISAGVVVGDGSDVGGGASIMGTLSGGGNIVISIGENSLIGANAGTGISLGNNCQVEAGCYVKATSKVKVLPGGQWVKASDLNGMDDLYFRRNTVTGEMEVLPRKNQVILNEALHGKQ